MGFVTDLLASVVTRETPREIHALSVPDTGEGYFPDGRVANNSLWLSPVTGSGPFDIPEDIPFQSGAYPYRDDGPQWSWEQGEGKAPGFEWPHWTIREQFSFESSTNMSGIMEDGTAELPADSNANPLLGKAERQGWAMLGPAISGEYFGQEVHGRMWYPEPIPIQVAPNVPLTAIAEVEE